MSGEFLVVCKENKHNSCYLLITSVILKVLNFQRLFQIFIFLFLQGFVFSSKENINSIPAKTGAVMFDSFLSPNLVGMEKITLRRNYLRSSTLHLKSENKTRVVLYHGKEKKPKPIQQNPQKNNNQKPPQNFV